MNFNEEMTDKIRQIEEMIQLHLPKEEGYQRTVIEAMNYAVLGGGKRLRPMLMAETAAVFGGAGESLAYFMMALECIHTYSLVHDDLPAMDNDDYRRGRKTVHIVYGEGMAVLAGDGLLNFAFETAAAAFHMASEPQDCQRIAKAVQILGNKAGIYGMIGGQCADLKAEEMGEDVTKDMLLYIHEHKTAALIQAAMMIGAVLAGADDEAVLQIEKCAYNIGIAFQIQDDILDVTGDEQVTGKPVGSDEKNSKTTYVTFQGLEGAKALVEAYSRQAIEILDGFPAENPFLRQLILSLINRKN